MVILAMSMLALLLIVGIAIRSVRNNHQRTDNQVLIKESVAVGPVAQTNGLVKLHQVLRDYGSTNNESFMTSILVRQLIAEQLLANEGFLEWGTNAAKMAIVKFLNGDVPIYEVSNVNPDDLKIEHVTVFAKSGLHVDIRYHALQITVDGGTNLIVTMVENPYKMEDYQIDPSHRRERMDWSHAARPLDKHLVDRMARDAFAQMTARNLDEFKVTPDIQTPDILNFDVKRPDVQVTGIPGANLISSTDKVYLFAQFFYRIQGSAYCPFNGEVVQTSDGHGEFVKLFAPVGSPDAMLSLAKKFLAPQSENWDQNLLDQVRSMNTEQQGEVYRRVFSH